MYRTILFLALATTFIGCHAQTSANVYVQDTVQCPSGFFSTNFAGVKIDSSTGYATVNFIGGDDADFNYVLSFETTDQSNPIWWETNDAVLFQTTGTYWIYLAASYSSSNWDWIEIRIVSSSFSGTVTPLYGTAPYGWTNGYPPSHVPMKIGPAPPASQAAPVSISKILVPILVVVIVLAIAIPAGVYMYRRRKANKIKMNTQQAEAAAEAAAATQQVQLEENSGVV